MVEKPDEIIVIKVIPNAGVKMVVKVDSCDSGIDYRVYVTAKPDGGKANSAAIEALASFMDLPKSLFRVIRGATSRTKVVGITCR